MRTGIHRAGLAGVGVAALLAATAVTTPASAAPKPGTTGWGGSGSVVSNAVIDGAVPFERGNKHQLRISSTGSQVTGYVRSYFCPTGATVTDKWASSKCVHRGTARLTAGYRLVQSEPAGSPQWISSTGRSAYHTGLFQFRKNAQVANRDFSIQAHLTHHLVSPNGTATRTTGGVGIGLDDYPLTTYPGSIRTN